MTQSEHMYKAFLCCIVRAQGYWYYFQIFTSVWMLLLFNANISMFTEGSLCTWCSAGLGSDANSGPRALTAQDGASVPWCGWLRSNLWQLLFFFSSASSYMSSTHVSLPWSCRSRRFSQWMRLCRATSSKSKVSVGPPAGWVLSGKLGLESRPARHYSASLLSVFFLHRCEKQWTVRILESALILRKLKLHCSFFLRQFNELRSLALSAECQFSLYHLLLLSFTWREVGNVSLNRKNL